MAGISTSDFFKTKRDVSEIKSEILNEYFRAWAAILLFGQRFKKVNQLLYVDLFAGPGIYEDGTISTPIKILNSINNSIGTRYDFNSYIQTVFNDVETKLVEQLNVNIEGLPYYNRLNHKPIIGNESASKEIMERISNPKIPSLTFIDPLGYGYTQKMLLYSIKNWGSDLFMLFNINRIRAAIANKKVEQNMSNIFEQHFSMIKDFYKTNKSPKEREKFIVQVFEAIFKEKGYKILRFKVNFPDKNQTSHYLFFISKVNIAITRAKEIMTKYSDIQQDGVPLFGANLVQPPMFFPSTVEYSIEKLKDVITLNSGRYNGMTLEIIYQTHNHGTNYIKPNYKQCIEELKNEGKVILKDKKGNITNRVTYTAQVLFKEV